MITNYSQEELQELELIRQAYIKEKGNSKTPEEEGELFLKFCIDIDRLNEQIERKHFSEYGNNTDKIYEAAINNLDELIKKCYENIVFSMLPEDIEKLNLGKYDNGKILVYQELLANEVKDELKLFIQALSSNEDLLQNLLTEIANKINNSDLTIPRENTNINDIDNLIKESIKKGKLKKSIYPLDKVNSNFFNNPIDEKKLIENTFKLGYNTSNKLKTKNNNSEIDKIPDIIIAVDFAAIDKNINIEIKKQLTPYDKRVYVAISSLHADGRDYMTLTQIHAAMGHKSRPNSNNIEKILKSIDKMSFTSIRISNKSECDNFPGTIPYTYEGYLLPLEKIYEGYKPYPDATLYHLFKEPPLYTISKNRNQCTTIKQAVLETPLPKTDNNIAIEDYLVKEISHMKNNPKFSKKMLYETIFKNIGISDRHQKLRTKNTINTCLEYYKSKEVGFIRDFSIAENGITIKL